MVDQNSALISSAEVVRVDPDEIQGERAFTGAAATEDEYE